jgi:hypothetical protein
MKVNGIPAKLSCYKVNNRTLEKQKRVVHADMLQHTLPAKVFQLDSLEGLNNLRSMKNDKVPTQQTI